MSDLHGVAFTERPDDSETLQSRTAEGQLELRHVARLSGGRRFDSDGVPKLTRRQIAWRAAQDILDGSYVNLGIGLPTLVADFIPADREIVFHSENGVLGLGKAPAPGEVDPDLINAGKGAASLLPGGSFFHHTDAFLMIRGGHVDLSLMGAFEVSAEGDLANWTTNDPHFAPGVGGAMDLAAGAREVRVLLEHTTKEGVARLRNRCRMNSSMGRQRRNHFCRRH